MPKKKLIDIEIEVTEKRTLAIDPVALREAQNAIAQMFAWSRSKEGGAYWSDVADKLEAYVAMLPSGSRE